MPPKGSRKLDAKQAARLRRRQLEEHKRALARRDRRRGWALSGLAVLVGAGIIAAVLVPQWLKPTPLLDRKLTSFGVSLTKAGCDSPTSPQAGKDTEIGPGSKHAQQTKGSYPSAPPAGGDHYVQPLPQTQNFYAPTAHPKVEQLVANELQGDTVAWYLPTLAKGDVKSLNQLAQRMAADNPNFIVAPWDTSYGAFPAGKQVAYATKGHVQYCTRPSGAAAQQFTQQFPAVAPTTPASPPTTSVSPVPTRSGTASPTTTASPKRTPTHRSSSAKP